MNSPVRWQSGFANFSSLAIAAAVGFIVLLAQAGPTAAQPVIEPSYVIGPEDVLDIQVWDNKDLNFGGFVRPDGKISLPLLGEVQASGFTVQQLQDSLTKQYAKTIKQPLVTVIVKTINSRPVYFIGAFGSPGVLQLTRDLTLLQAVGLRGGLAVGGDAEKGYLLRGDKTIAIDFDRLMKKGDLSQNMKLEPGDTVVVPLADVVYLEGEVRKPGTVKYTSDLTVVQAITQAGGLTPMAAGNRVDVLRSEEGKGEGKKVRIRVNVDKILSSPEGNPDMNLRPDDIIFVPQRWF